MKRMAPPDIPDEQLQRLQPMVDDLLKKLHSVMDRLPPTTDSSLIFEPGPDGRE